MTNEKKSKWSVIVNIILTTLTAIATAFGLTSCM
ncbi:MAG: smalltalk protein [Bacteroidaceae bacterium]|nr:smalltalk protein [Bacteroidaceae bacterium]MBQ6038154.1 smalltalk protein [Bacteroidaceae bacterium]MBQ9499867.1 smalltalk protein [Bacteroidaceae bacterium]